MDAVNYGSARTPASTPVDATQSEPRKSAIKSIFARFLDALKMTRRRQARRVIATYAHLLADPAVPDQGQSKKP